MENGDEIDVVIEQVGGNINAWMISIIIICICINQYYINQYYIRIVLWIVEDHKYIEDEKCISNSI